MDPKQRNLRLRKSTLRKLDPESAARARGGTIIIFPLTGTCSIWPCPETVSAKYSNCPHCWPNTPFDCTGPE